MHNIFKNSIGNTLPHNVSALGIKLYKNPHKNRKGQVHVLLQEGLALGTFIKNEIAVINTFISFNMMFENQLRDVLFELSIYADLIEINKKEKTYKHKLLLQKLISHCKEIFENLRPNLPDNWMDLSQNTDVHKLLD